MNDLIFSLETVAPVFLIVLLGSVLRKLKVINENFVTVSAKFVFSSALPALVFLEILKADFSENFNINLISYIYIATLISFIIGIFVAYKISNTGKDRSVIIQGSFRGNYAIVGLALIQNIYGEKGLADAAIVLAFILPMYNVLSILALTYPLKKEKNVSAAKILLEIVKNPLLIGLFSALIVSYFKINLNGIIISSLEYLSALSLPLALIGIGGVLKFEDLRSLSKSASIASFLKIVIVPSLFTTGAYFLGFRNTELLIMFILFSSPTAIASYIMAEAMGCNGKLAANIILITTIFSAFTIAAGLFLLKYFLLI